jgi:DNA-binding NtrC family response regulator
MRIKILLVGDDPVSLMADGQVLRDRGMLVFTTFNTDNLHDLISEINPDLLFFDPKTQDKRTADTYNDIINDSNYAGIPVIYTLSEDEVYLITQKKTETKVRKSLTADNMTTAIKEALYSNKSHHKKAGKTINPTLLPPPNTMRA